MIAKSSFIRYGTPVSIVYTLRLKRENNKEAEKKSKEKCEDNNHLVVEHHQTRVQHQRRQRMESQVDRQRHNRSIIRNRPVRVRESSQVNHTANDQENEDVHPLERLEDLGQLLEEVGVLLLLGGGAPLHVDVEEVGQQRERDVEGDAAEEAGHQRRPLEVLDQAAEEGAFAGAVAEEGEGDVAEQVEDYDQGEQDVPAGQVALGQVFEEPADEEVVEGGEDEGGS